VTEPTPPGDILALVLGKLEGVRKSGGKWIARCPAHEDCKASLEVRQGTKQPVVLRCYAACETADVLAKIGLTLADVSLNSHAPAGDDWTPAGPAIATYPYTDPAGEVQFGVCRTADKQFRQWRPDPAKPHGRAWSVKGVKLVLYRLPKVIAAVDAGETIFVVEGEKDVHALEDAGVTATCNPMGAGKWRATYSKTLAGASVVIVADNDKPGIAHARKVAESLDGVAASVRLARAREGKDVGDHLAAGYGVDDFIDLALNDAENDEQSHLRAVASHLHTLPSWASDQDILSRLECDMGVWCGFTGEHRNAKLVYLAITSRIFDDPVSVAVKGLSSSGKSYTVTAVLRFFPEEAVITMTAMSERALIYMKEDFAHRTLVLFEAVALREEREKTESNLTAYIVRSLLSEGEIRYPVAVRGDGGNIETRWIIKPGPTNMILTTTATSLHGENETRMLSLPTDDSAAQTTSIMKAIAAGQRIDADFSEWHAYARSIAAGNKNVVIPYAGWLAESIPPVAVRLRRDFRALLRLIEAHAILHQLNRATDEQGRIVATEADYLAVRELVADLISDAVGSAVSATVRQTTEAVAELDAGEGVTVHRLAEHLGLERSTVQYRVTAAREKGYLVNAEDKRGRAARWRTGNPLPDDVVILPPRIEGVNSDPGPLHTTLGDDAPQVSGGVDGGCEGVNQLHGGEPDDDMDTSATSADTSADQAEAAALCLIHGRLGGQVISPRIWRPGLDGHCANCGKKEAFHWRKRCS
jgi:5S rRNA maturation endonuclease (ribonuclease M5)